MSEILDIINSISGDCDCGLNHQTAIRDIQIASGLVNRVGNILRKNGFPSNLLLVADKNTLKAADGILESLDGFNVSFKIFDNLRVAEMKHVNEIDYRQRPGCFVGWNGLCQRPLQVSSRQMQQAALHFCNCTFNGRLCFVQLTDSCQRL